MERLPRTLHASLDYLDVRRNDPWEVILVDDGSSDGTAAFAATVASKEKRLRVLRSEVNCGKGAALASTLPAIHWSARRALDSGVCPCGP